MIVTSLNKRRDLLNRLKEIFDENVDDLAIQFNYSLGSFLAQLGAWLNFWGETSGGVRALTVVAAV